MSTKVKEQVSEVTKDAPHEMEPPMYSDVFLKAMEDYAYETLHEYLKKVSPDAQDLFDNLMVLTNVQKICQQNTPILYVWNEEASYCIGRISQLIPKLGGHFITPSGELLEA